MCNVYLQNMSIYHYLSIYRLYYVCIFYFSYQRNLEELIKLEIQMYFSRLLLSSAASSCWSRILTGSGVSNQTSSFRTVGLTFSMVMLSQKYCIPAHIWQIKLSYDLFYRCDSISIVALQHEVYLIFYKYFFLPFPGKDFLQTCASSVIIII